MPCSGFQGSTSEEISQLGNVISWREAIQPYKGRVFMRGMHQRAASFILVLIFCTSGIPVVSDQKVLAQATTAITSSGLNTQVSAPTTLSNGQVNINITGGTRPGNGTNLFHSFGDFSVGANHIANFLNETDVPPS